jgi:nucleotide-binding universal stress UspA family protein
VEVEDYFPTRIVLATDGSRDAKLAARAASDLARSTGSELHAVHAWRVPHPPSFLGQAPRDHPSWRAGFEEEARRLLLAEAGGIRASGGAVAEEHLREGRAQEEISDLARELGAGLVVVGRRGMGAVERLLLGSVSEGVVQLVSCPVLVVGSGGDAGWPPARVVVGVDLSKESEGAAWLGAEIAWVYGAGIDLLLAISETSEGTPADDASGEKGPEPPRELLELAQEVGERFGVNAEAGILAGEAASALLEACKSEAEPVLASVGNRGLGAVERAVLGSVSSDVLRAAGGPVLVVKRSSRSGDREP